MNDHVGKPIDVDLTVRAILALTQPKAASDDRNAVPSPQPSPQPTLSPAPAGGLRVEPMDVILRRFMGQRDLMARMLPDFEEQTRALLDDLAAALDAGDQEAATAILHKIKGTADLFGGKGFANDIARAHDGLRKRDPAIRAEVFSEPWLGTVRRAFEDNIDYVKNEIAASGEPSAVPAGRVTGVRREPDGGDRRNLEELLRLLEKNNLRALEMLEALQGTQTTVAPEKLAQVLEHVRAFEFPAAASLFRELLGTR